MTPVCVNKNVSQMGHLIDSSNKFWTNNKYPQVEN